MPNSKLRNCFHVHIRGSQPGRCIRWCLVAVGLTISVQAKAEYRVNVGDVLEVAVAGVPELRQRAPVQVDGNISLPLVGMLPIAGLPLPEIRSNTSLLMPAITGSVARVTSFIRRWLTPCHGRAKLLKGIGPDKRH